MHITRPDLPTSDVGSTQSPLLEQAAALVAFAENDSEFRRFLYHHTSQLPRDVARPKPEVMVSSYLLPRDAETAGARAHWLLSEIARVPREESLPALATLLDWRKHLQPQEQIIGIVGIAIIGPTLGIINKRKKKKSAMPVIVENSFARAPREELVKLVHEASTTLSSNALRAVNGNAHRLVPDLFEWFFEDRLLSLYHAKHDTLAHLETALAAERLPYTAIKTADRLAAIALSPEVNEDLLETIPVKKL